MIRRQVCRRNNQMNKNLNEYHGDEASWNEKQIEIDT